ncbi:MAG: HAD family hydrolase [Pseudomonadota bacterium]
MKKNKAIFLDRDGTLNYDPGYLDDPDKLKLLPGVGEGLKILQDAGFKLVVITNQAGIGRAKFTEKTLQKIHERLKELLKAYSVELTAIYYCPHHPDENCNCRKPKTGMVDLAVREHNLDLKKSFVIGDDKCDQVLAKNLNCPFVEVGGDEFKNIKEAANYILRAGRKE